MKNIFFICVLFVAFAFTGCKKQEDWSQKFVGVYTGHANCGAGDIPGEISVSAAGPDNLSITCIVTCFGSLSNFSAIKTGDYSFSLSTYCDGYTISGSGSFTADGQTIFITVGNFSISFGCSVTGVK